MRYKRQEAGADKPNSVFSRPEGREEAAISLSDLPVPSRTLSGQLFFPPKRKGGTYVILHRAGFLVPPALLPARWSLTPPFHLFLLSTAEAAKGDVYFL